MPDSPQDLHKKILGRKGERLVEDYLKKQGCKFLYMYSYGCVIHKLVCIEVRQAQSRFHKFLHMYPRANFLHLSSFLKMHII